MKLIFLNLLIICIGCGFAYAESVPAPVLKPLLEITGSDSATALLIMQQAAGNERQPEEQLLPNDTINSAIVGKMNCDKTGVRSRLHRHRRQRKQSGYSGFQQRRGQGQGRGRH